MAALTQLRGASIKVPFYTRNVLYQCMLLQAQIHREHTAGPDYQEDVAQQLSRF